MTDEEIMDLMLEEIGDQEVDAVELTRSQRLTDAGVSPQWAMQMLHGLYEDGRVAFDANVVKVRRAAPKA